MAITWRYVLRNRLFALAVRGSESRAPAPAVAAPAAPAAAAPAAPAVAGNDRGSHAVRYVVVVGRQHPDRLVFWQREFASEPRVQVLMDRRRDDRRQREERGGRERRRLERRRPLRTDEDLRTHPVVLIPRDPERRYPVTSHLPAPPNGGERNGTSMDGTRTDDVRERIDRWAAEGQHVLARFIPALLDEGDQGWARARAAERECEILRQQNGLLQVEVKWLLGEIDRFKAERQEIVEAVNRRVSELTQPFNEIVRRLTAA